MIFHKVCNYYICMRGQGFFRVINPIQNKETHVDFVPVLLID